MQPAGLRHVDEFQACLALRHTKGLGPRTWKRLLDFYGSAVAAVSAHGTWAARRLASARVTGEFALNLWRERADAEQAQRERLGLEIVTYSDGAYPELLRQIPDPPLVLYLRGDATLLKRPCVAVVGSRQCSRYGVGMAGNIATDLSRAGICVVSGFAQGIDRAAHLGALSAVGSTIAVLGTGIDLLYPPSNRDLWERIAETGLIISEFSPGTRPEGPNFPHRNRVVSGLALGVLVVEAALGSGSLITAGLALTQNREVFALPGPANLVTYRGCHELIRQGACLVQSGADIVHELQPLLRASCPVEDADGPASAPAATAAAAVLSEPTDPDQRALFCLLRDGGARHVDGLTQDTGWPAHKISATLLFMELQGLVKQLPGMYYCLTI